MATALRPLVALVLLAVIALAGCGDDDDDADGGGSDASAALELVDRLPRSEAFDGVTYVDVEAARAALDLDDAVDPRTSFVDGTEAERRFSYAVGNVVAYIASPYETPLIEAIDSTQITAAASNLISFGEDAMTVIATDQPFEEIASALEDAGFERDGNVLTTDRPFREVGAQAVAGNDELVALGFDAELVEAVAAGQASTSAAEAEAAGDVDPRELATELGGPAGGAIASSAESCVAAFGVVDRLAGGEGEFVMVTSEADPEIFKLDDQPEVVLQNLEFGEITAEDDRIRAPFTAPLGEVGIGPLGILRSDLTSDSIYECPA